ncbi:interleukin-17F-like [Leptodactylus fuscus]|uniref:interleukin-17F-like n=1 Tax=Leptodactylus fuscus TaxID=238119 RepID=UPI003F4E860A
MLFSMLSPSLSIAQVTLLVSVCSSAFLPEGYLSHINTQEGSRDEEPPLEAKGRCPGRRNRRLPTSMTLDISLIDTNYLDSLVQMEDINSRSLSPWEYSLNTDPNRFPFVISEANCLTFSCVDVDGHDNPELISYPIQQEVLVLRQEQKGCSFSYRLETEVVTVGCTCVTPVLAYH